MKRPLRILTLNIYLLLILTPPVLFAQSSILEQILNTRQALVEVLAENISLHRSDSGHVALNPQTGQLVHLQNIKKSAYTRQGAGVIIHPSGVLVTNAHIIHKADRISIILADGQQVPARIVRYLNELDLALLKIDTPSPLHAVTLADSDQIRLGDEIMTVGHSFLLNQTVSGGRVIGLGTSLSKIQKGQTRTELIQTSFNLYEGDSGGPLFDRQGHLIGLMTAKEMNADHSSFAVPSNRIARYLNGYLKSLKDPNQTK